MLQSSDYKYDGKSNPPSNSNPVKTTSAPIEQATIGRSLHIKGEVSGAEALYIDGRIEGKITLAEHRVTIGRNGVVEADITAREVVVMGKVTGNIECGDRVDIRSEGVVNGNVSTVRISVEDGAVLKGGIQVKTETKHSKSEQKSSAPEPVQDLAATAAV